MPPADHTTPAGRRRRRHVTVVTTAAFVALAALPALPGASAQTGRSVVVDPNGNDAAAGTDAAPLRTIQAALTRVGPGDRILIRNGTYDGGGGAAVRIQGINGRHGAPITLIPYPGHRPVFRGGGWQIVHVLNSSHIELHGFHIEGTANTDRQPTTGIDIEDSHHVKVQGAVIRDTGGGGINGMRSDHVWIEGNAIIGTSRWNPYQTSAISLFQSTHRGGGPNLDSFQNYIVGNVAHHNENLAPGPQGKVTDGNCIIIDSSQDTGYRGRTLISNNVCAANGGRGINVTRSGDVVAVNNTLINNVRSNAIHADGGGEIFAGQSHDLIFRNNLVMPTRPNGGNNVWASSRVSFDHNVYSQPPRVPGVLDRVAADLQLAFGVIPVGTSPAKDAANPDLAPPTDRVGRPRVGGPDAGAYEGV
jgi:hypothetical protein